MGLIVPLAIMGVLLAIGFVFGRAAEKRHLAQLFRRERAHQHILATQVKSFVAPELDGKAPTLFIAECVVASDYLKNFLAKFRNILGGEVRSYDILISRARREAIVRLKEQAARDGYNALCNVRLSTASIGATSGKRAAVMAPILASATAYRSTLAPPAAQVMATPLS